MWHEEMNQIEIQNHCQDTEALEGEYDEYCFIYLCYTL